MTGRFAASAMAAGIVAFSCVAGCAGFNPAPIDSLDLSSRASVQSEAGLRVKVAVLSRDEAAEVFGVNLHERGVQPVWLEIENQTDKPYWFMMHGLDPNYFSAHEVAYMNHKFMQGDANREMDRYFRKLGIEQRVSAGRTVSGYVFGNETIGTKEVRVQLLADGELRTFDFFVSVSGLKSEWERRDFRSLYVEEEWIQTETEEELHSALMTLDCCTQHLDGSGKGAPLNLVLVDGEPAIMGMIKAGWDETVFKYSIVTVFESAYLFGRSPDLQFSKSRRRVDSTTLVRLWLSPIRYQGNAVIVGSVSRSSDPRTDEAALFLAEDLVTARAVARWGQIDGVGQVSKASPHQTFANSPYWTNGRRLVLEMSREPVALDEVEMWTWDWTGRQFRREEVALTDDRD